MGLLCLLVYLTTFFSLIGYVALNRSMVLDNKLRKCGRKCPWSILGHFSNIFLENFVNCNSYITLTGVATVNNDLFKTNLNIIS